MERLRFFLNRPMAGQAMVEYALILVLCVIIVLIVLMVMGNTVKNMYCNVTASLGSP